jgi:hypothetical protein
MTRARRARRLSRRTRSSSRPSSSRGGEPLLDGEGEQVRRLPVRRRPEGPDGGNGRSAARNARRSHVGGGPPPRLPDVVAAVAAHLGTAGHRDPDPRARVVLQARRLQRRRAVEERPRAALEHRRPPVPRARHRPGVDADRLVTDAPPPMSPDLGHDHPARHAQRVQLASRHHPALVGRQRAYLPHQRPVVRRPQHPVSIDRNPGARSGAGPSLWMADNVIRIVA